MVAAFKPDPNRRREIPDPGLRGLYLIVQPSGAKSWAVRYRVKGSRRLLKATLGGFPVLSVAAAREKATAALGEAAAGKDPVAEQRERELAERRDAVEAVVTRFLAEHVERNRRANTYREYKRLLEHDVLPWWKGRTVQSIARRDIVEVRNRVAERAPFLANRTVAVLKRLFRWAVDNSYVEHNVARDVDKPMAERKRDRVLSDAELAAVWTACDEARLAIRPAGQAADPHRPSPRGSRRSAVERTRSRYGGSMAAAGRPGEEPPCEYRAAERPGARHPE